MKQSPPDALYAYWTSLRGDAIAPRRFDIEPSRIAPLLPHTFILEKLSPRDYRYRIAGTSVCEIFGLEMRDQSFFDGWEAADQLILERTLAVVTRRGGVARFELDAKRELDASGRFSRPGLGTANTVQLRGVLLPLLHTEGRIDRVLGALSIKEPTGPVPEAHSQRPLAGWRLAALDTEWPRNPSVSIPAGEAPGTPVGVDPDAIQARLLGQDRDWLSAAASSAAARTTDNGDRADGDRGHGDRQAPFAPHIRKARIVRSDRRQFRVYEGGLGASDLPDHADTPSE